MPKQHSINSDLVRSLAALLDETNLSEIEYDQGGLRVRVARQTGGGYATPVMNFAPPYQQGNIPAPSAGATTALPANSADDPAKHPGVVTSPMVGVVYMAPEPNAPRFFNIGDNVSEGQTILLIEAMKTFNPIPAPRSGKVTRLLIQEGQPVEFGEPLLIIE